MFGFIYFPFYERTGFCSEGLLMHLVDILLFLVMGLLGLLVYKIPENQ